MNHEQNVRPAKGAGKITNVRYYTEDGTQVQEAVSTLEMETAHGKELFIQISL